MKLLVDNNLSFKLVHPLQDHCPGTEHIRDTLSVNTDDNSIWNYAKPNDFIILTKDNDFDERSQLEGCPPKVIHLICGNKTTVQILNLLLRRKEEISLFADTDSENCIFKIS